MEEKRTDSMKEIDAIVLRAWATRQVESVSRGLEAAAATLFSFHRNSLYIYLDTYTILDYIMNS